LAGKIAGFVDDNFANLISPLVSYASPNLTELKIMGESLRRGQQVKDLPTSSPFQSINSILDECESFGKILIDKHLVKTLVVTLGEKGVATLDSLVSLIIILDESVV